ncbi:MAG: EAL domain-containing protein [Pseudomonadales bacterium]
MRAHFRRWLPPIVGIALTIVAASLDLLSPLDRMFSDFRSELLEQEVDSDALIVAIDARSLRELNEWPWSRARHAALLERLDAAGPRSVFMDIDFSVTSDDAAADAALAEVLGRPRDHTVILPVFWQDASIATSHTRVLTEPLAAFAATTSTGLVNLSPGPGGLVREALHRDRFGDRDYFSPGALLAERTDVAFGRSYPIDFRISPQSFNYVSYVDVLNGRIPDSAIRDRRVFVGATALELGDNVPVPLHRTLPGVTLQAIIYETLRGGVPHTAPTWAAALALLVVLAASAAGGTRRWSVQLGIWIALIVSISVVSLQALATFDILLNTAAPMVLGTLCFLASLIATADREAMAAFLAGLRLNRERALVSGVFAASIDGILVIDTDGRILEANQAAADYFGSSASELTDQSILTLLPGLPRSTQATQRTGVIEAGRWELDARGAGGRSPVELSISPAQSAAASLLTVILRDIGERHRQQALLRHQATHDPLTGLPNRTRLSRDLKTLTDMRTAALFMLDLDGFKKVNDTLGHRIGDDLLRELGKRLRRDLPKNVRIYRIGGDEFAVLVARHGGQPELETLAGVILERVREPVKAGSMVLELSGSIGISLYPQHARDGDMLLQCADVAMYAAKASHVGVELYDAAADHNTVRNLKLAAALRRAVKHEQLRVVYQPKVRLSDGLCVGVEALVRWTDPELGEVSPGEFIPVAETSDLIEPITRFTLNRAIRDHVRWCAKGIDIGVSVNLSARHVADPGFVEEILRIVNWHGLHPSRLELEITETALMQDPERARQVLTRLTSQGIRLAIDDFGTGFSSLAYLKHLRLHTLKIDRCFVSELRTRESDRKIVSSTLSMAHSLDLEVVAEGIETEAQASLLTSMGCDLGQGFVFAKPMSAEEFAPWVHSRSELPAVASAR